MVYAYSTYEVHEKCLKSFSVNTGRIQTLLVNSPCMWRPNIKASLKCLAVDVDDSHLEGSCEYFDEILGYTKDRAFLSGWMSTRFSESAMFSGTRSMNLHSM